MLVSFEIFVVFTAGLVMGSFATALSWRIPLKQGWTVDDKDGTSEKKLSRSSCPKCDHQLGVFDLIPVFSWLFLGGKCRYCKQSISMRYPLIELSCGFAALGCYFVYGFSPVTAIFIAALPFFMAMFLIDLKHFMLPDQLNVILAVLGGLVYLLSMHDILMQQAFSASAIFHLIYWLFYPFLALLIAIVMKLILKKEVLGVGDIKFFAVAGLWLGLSALPLFLFFSGLLGVILGGLYQLSGRGRYFPFGPALISAFFVVFLFKGMGLTL